MKTIAESYIQQQCLLWLSTYSGMIKHEPARSLMFSIPNELAMGIRSALLDERLPVKIIDKAIALALKKAKNTGFTTGVADTIVMLPNSVTLYIEFKTEIGRQSTEQIEFQRRAEMLGHKYYLCRSLSQFQNIIKSNTKVTKV